MMKKPGVSLIEVILSASMILVVLGIIFTLVIGTSRRISVLDGRKEVKDSIEGFRSILGDKLRGITCIKGISDNGDELEFTYEEGEDFTSRDVRVFIRTVSISDKQLVIQYNDEGNRTDILLKGIDTFKAELFNQKNFPVETLSDTRLIKIKVWIHRSGEEKIKDEFIVKLRRVY